MDKIEVYKKILKVMDQHKDIIEQDYQIDITGKLRDRIMLQELESEFGIELSVDANPRYCEVSDYEKIYTLGEKHNRTISWSDDGSQPEDETLYVISFPTGAYIFSDSRPEETFRSFWDELKAFCPKYCDTANNNLYFTSEKSKIVHENFKPLYDKYEALVGEEVKRKKIESLKQELESLTD